MIDLINQISKLSSNSARVDGLIGISISVRGQAEIHLVFDAFVDNFDVFSVEIMPNSPYLMVSTYINGVKAFALTRPDELGLSIKNEIL